MISYRTGLDKVLTSAGNYVFSYNIERRIYDIYLYDELYNEEKIFVLQKAKMQGFNPDTLAEYSEWINRSRQLWR